ncbi:MAG: rhomboid family intramembrane serine protease [Deltaproteobacteria bacterium]|nr:rhomboid family intramembrane serine protease [Deltaproteobacteria bacterium]
MLKRVSIEILDHGSARGKARSIVRRYRKGQFIDAMIYREREILLRIAPGRKVAEEWALVLATQGISASVRRTQEGFALGVPVGDAERAATALFRYVRENRGEVQEEHAPAGSGHLLAGLAVSVALLVLFLVTGSRNPAVLWFERGSADAGRIVNGDLWLTVTALTLHTDVLHVLGNAIMGAIFLSASFRLLGVGLGGALILLAGAGGNFVNALLQSAPHNSVGASTALFGALGILGGLGVARRRRTEAGGRRAWVPFAAGLALLAWLGTAGPRVDLGAHLFGFLLGCVLGLFAGIAFPRPPGARLQWTLGIAALATVFYSWVVALR